jgi:hypothetical protein
MGSFYIKSRNIWVHDTELYDYVKHYHELLYEKDCEIAELERQVEASRVLLAIQKGKWNGTEYVT